MGALQIFHYCPTRVVPPPSKPISNLFALIVDSTVDRNVVMVTYRKYKIGNGKDSPGHNTNLVDFISQVPLFLGRNNKPIE